jgi:hypothetical protein
MDTKNEGDEIKEFSSRPIEQLSARGMSAMQGERVTEVPDKETAETLEMGVAETDSKLSPRGEAALQGQGETPTEKADTPTAPKDDQQVNEGISRLQQIPEIKPEVWSELSEEERLAALQQVENTMADVQGRPPVNVTAEDMGSNSAGAFDGNSIRINVAELQSENVAEAVDTIVHEGRHAYQQHAVDNPGSHENNEQVKAWEANLNDYKDPQFDEEEYRKQPVEADAWAYGSAVRDGLYS